MIFRAATARSMNWSGFQGIDILHPGGLVPHDSFHPYEVNDPEAFVSRHHGICTGTGCAPSLSFIMRMARSKSAPILSSLLTKTIRGTL